MVGGPLPSVMPRLPFRVEKDKLSGLYKCHLCGYKSVYGSSVRSHYAVHSPARPFACDLCDYEAKRVNDLRKHKILKHVKSSGRRRVQHPNIFQDPETGSYRCHLCSYQSESPKCVRSHMAVHSDERPYACDLCDYEAKRSSDLSKHKVIKHGIVSSRRKTGDSNSLGAGCSISLYTDNDTSAISHSGNVDSTFSNMAAPAMAQPSVFPGSGYDDLAGAFLNQCTDGSAPAKMEATNTTPELDLIQGDGGAPRQFSLSPVAEWVLSPVDAESSEIVKEYQSPDIPADCLHKLETATESHNEQVMFIKPEPPEDYDATINSLQVNDESRVNTTSQDNSNEVHGNEQFERRHSKRKRRNSQIMSRHQHEQYHEGDEDGSDTSASSSPDRSPDSCHPCEKASDGMAEGNSCQSSAEEAGFRPIKLDTEVGDRDDGHSDDGNQPTGSNLLDHLRAASDISEGLRRQPARLVASGEAMSPTLQVRNLSGSMLRRSAVRDASPPISNQSTDNQAAHGINMNCNDSSSLARNSSGNDTYDFKSECRGYYSNTGQSSSNQFQADSTQSPRQGMGRVRKSWHCVHCDIMFFDGALYFMHTGLHNNVDPWKCNMCGEKYHDVYGFTSHFVNGHS